LRTTLERLLAAVDVPEATVSLSLVRDPEMRELNREHRQKDKPTDVLSFPLYEPDAFERNGRTRPREAVAGERMLGDIVISVDTAQTQAVEYDATLAREVERLLIHGVLHLCGHDHEEAGERRLMEREERRLAEAIGMPWPYLGELR
jgi:probable rRNA maturation factor